MADLIARSGAVVYDRSGGTERGMSMKTSSEPEKNSRRARVWIKDELFRKTLHYSDGENSWEREFNHSDMLLGAGLSDDGSCILMLTEEKEGAGRVAHYVEALDSRGDSIPGSYFYVDRSLDADELQEAARLARQGNWDGIKSLSRGAPRPRMVCVATLGRSQSLAQAEYRSCCLQSQDEEPTNPFCRYCGTKVLEG